MYRINALDNAMPPGQGWFRTVWASITVKRKDAPLKLKLRTSMFHLKVSGSSSLPASKHMESKTAETVQGALICQGLGCPLLPVGDGILGDKRVSAIFVLALKFFYFDATK